MKALVRGTAMLAIALLIAWGATLRSRYGRIDPPFIQFEPVLVRPTIQLEGALVRGASANWATLKGARARYGDPLPVVVTAYCLQGRTRRDGWVREGIVAADPKIFPLARYVEIYVEHRYFGRFLVDDTGKHIKGGRLDIWTTTCTQARRFGRQRGLAVLVPKPRGAAKDTVLTGRLGGAKKQKSKNR